MELERIIFCENEGKYVHRSICIQKINKKCKKCNKSEIEIVFPFKWYARRANCPVYEFDIIPGERSPVIIEDRRLAEINDKVISNWDCRKSVFRTCSSCKPDKLAKEREKYEENNNEGQNMETKT